MRVIAGRLGGRTFDSPPGHRTHPMSERMRGALFNALGDLNDLTVLDAYAGSGALGIESISRGAVSAVMIDIDKAAISTIVNTVQLFGIERSVSVVQSNAASWSGQHSDQLFDIVFCDPPYDHVQVLQIAQLSRHVVKDGLLVLSIPKTLERLALEGFVIERDKSYAEGSLVFYRHIA